MTGGSNSHETTSEEANGLATDFVSEGIIGSYSNTGGVAPATGAFAVNAQGTPDMTVAVSSGVAYVAGTPTSQNSQTFRVYNSASENVTISANSSGSTKYDWVYIKLDATLLANPTLAGTTTATLVTSRSTSAGTDDGTPPTYGYPIAVVTVANGATTITNSTIRDIRATASIGTAAGIATGWNETGLPAVSSVTNNGNRSYNITFASTVASLLSPGMRLRTTRTVSAPTQCTDLESGSSQYFSSASAGLAGMTFTDDFTCMAWVKLESYTTGSIITRRNAGVSGFGLRTTSSGQLEIYGGTASAFDLGTSYQSLPLGKWTHVAASMDISGTSALLYIDGVLVPSAYTNTAAGSITQAGDLCVGAITGGTELSDGKIAQVAVFSSVLSASTIRSYMSQGLSGSESTLVSAFSCNNSLLDLNTTNNNDLTANGGALMTNADSPFANATGTPSGTTDVALVMAVSGSTATVQLPEGCTIPTSGGVSAVAYSTTANPFGWVVDKGRWQTMYLGKADATTATPVQNTFYGGTQFYMTVPVGAWKLEYCASLQINDAGGVGLFGGTTLSTSSSAASDSELDAYVTSTAVTNKTIVSRAKDISVSSATLYYLLYRVEVANIDNVYILGSTSPAIIKATPAGI